MLSAKIGGWVLQRAFKVRLQVLILVLGAEELGQHRKC